MISNAGQMFTIKNSFSGASTLSIFYELVKSNGNWDYKLEENWERDLDVPFLGLDGKFIYNGKITTAEDFGNIHYGFVGTSLGFSPTVLYIGGGYAKCGFNFEILNPPYYCDDVNDHYNIQRGIDMFYNWPQ